MAEPKVSIIVPLYNCEDFFYRCVDSLINQTLEDIEIILVDDGSTDSTPLLCDKAKEKDNRIKVIHKENEGAGKARNAGLEIAEGEYIGFVDSDDFIEPDMYQVLYEKATLNSSQLVISGIRYVDGNVFSKTGETEVLSYFDEDTHFEGKEEINKLCLGFSGSLPNEKEDSRYGTSVWKNLFKRDVILTNSLKFESEREMLSEDLLFLLDYAGCINKATGIPGAFYNYIRNPQSISKSYRENRFSKGLVFIEEAEKRLKNSIEYKDYIIYLNRYWQSFCRFVCSQEILYARDNKIPYKKLRERLKMICENPKTVSVLKSYPFYRLPLKQAIFAFAMKFKLYYLLVKMVVLRAK